jgi:hypothetical protein
MIGIYEFQVKNLDIEFSRMFEEYLPYFGISLARVKTKQLRVIPVESAVTALHHVAPYNKIREMVRQQESVSSCLRLEHIFNIISYFRWKDTPFKSNHYTIVC